MRIFRWITIAFVGFGLLITLIAVLGSVGSRHIPKSVALVIPIGGEVSDTPGTPLEALLSRSNTALSVLELHDAITFAAEDTRVQGIVLHLMDAPWTMAQVQEFEAAMTLFRDAGKPTLAFVETAGEWSPGNIAYALAATCDKIILAESGMVNLTGLRAEAPFFANTLERLELDIAADKRHSYKNAVNHFTERTFDAPHRESINAVLTSLEQDLIEHIVRRRGVEERTARSWLSSGSMSSAQALTARVVDDIGYWDSALKSVHTWIEDEKNQLNVGDYYRRLDAPTKGTKLAVLVGEGEIHRGRSQDNLGSKSMGSITLTRGLRQAREDGVKGVLFRINSPGGSYLASDLIRREVQLTREAGIPVVVSMGSMAASGGYFVAMDANHIIAHPGTLTGSIGVYSMHFGVRRAMRRWFGIEFDSIETNESASMFSGLDVPQGSHKEKFAATLDRIYKDFVTKAAQGRNTSYEDMHKVAQGRVWTGRHAVERGLVDDLGGLSDATRWLRKKAGLDDDRPVQWQLYPSRASGIEELLDLLGSGMRVIRSAVTTLEIHLSSSQHVLRAPHLNIR